VIVAVFIMLMLEFNAGVGLVYGFAVYLMTLAVSGFYGTSVSDE
jgi:hypothetical protein